MKAVALANSLAAVSFLGFLICVVWAAVDQSTFIAFWNSWFHGFNIEILTPESGLQIGAGQAIFGIVSFTISGWLTGYLIAWFYNRFDKNSKEVR